MWIFSPFNTLLQGSTSNAHDKITGNYFSCPTFVLFHCILFPFVPLTSVAFPVPFFLFEFRNLGFICSWCSLIHVAVTICILLFTSSCHYVNINQPAWVTIVANKAKQHCGQRELRAGKAKQKKENGCRNEQYLDSTKLLLTGASIAKKMDTLCGTQKTKQQVRCKCFKSSVAPFVRSYLIIPVLFEF